jgi:hypothetical protein
MDLLTAEEEAIDLSTGQLRFDIPLLARRVIASIDWLAATPCPSSGGLMSDAGRR